MLKKLALLLLLLMVFSCAKRKAAKQAEKDEKTIKEYVLAHNLNATRTGSGLYYVISTPGSGVNPVASSKVTVKYKGYLKDGAVFDESATAGATFGLSSVIRGWQEGIPYFKKGGKGMLLIPSALGYGNQANGQIPANSVLIFDIELLNIQ